MIAMIDNSIEFYEKRLVDIEQNMKWCRQDMEAGIDYDYSQDLIETLDQQREETRLDMAIYKRRVG
jgi:5'-3' exonuclease